ncbi:MAG: ATP-binding cassette domain-containing protein [Propionibacteriales bacterium]|nr:ATP-binding cassette domain-containing protein [Propionibacteriales bacterium]
MSPDPDAAVRVRGVRVLFGGVAALDRIDLDVVEGEVFVLVGPNGSGKTTLLNAVSGFVPLAEGSVELFGEDVTRRRAHQRADRGIGRTFQSPRALQSARVTDLLSFGLYRHDPRSWAGEVFRPLRALRLDRQVDERFRTVLDTVGLPDELLHEELGSLSHGQMKMVDIARALLGEPRVLLLDEPTSGLNQGEIDKLHEIVQGLRTGGCTPVLVEHNVQFVVDLADRIAVLHQGELLALGEPRATLSRDEVVEAYLGPKGRLAHRDGGHQAETRN